MRHRRHLIWLVLALAAVLELRSLGRNEIQTQYYEAAVRSMAHSWKAFLFASLDPGSFITVDKPPLAFWPQAALVRLFGLGRWTVGLPQVVESLLTVFVLWRIVTRRFGDAAGLIAAFALSVTPIVVAASHDNIPDPLLTLLLVSAAWATLRGAEDGRLRWLLLAGLFLGLGFQTKAIASFLVLPALALGYWIAASAPWRRRVACLAAGGVSIVVCSLPWVLLVALTPASDRPWIGGSSDNTALGLAFSRTGFDRFGQIGDGFRPLGFGGTPSFTRLFNTELAGQGAWFVAAAAAGALLAGWSAWLARDRWRLGAIVLFAVWALVHGLLFSYATGIFHAYYLVALAPALAALVGAGAVAAWETARDGRLHRLGLAAAVALAVLAQLAVLGRTPDYHTWLRPLALGLGAAALLGLLAGGARNRALPAYVGLALAGAALAVAPTAWAVGASAKHQVGPIPLAGPLHPAAYPQPSRPGLALYLFARRHGERWDAATVDAISATPLILDGLRVAALGGFLGVDPAGTPASVGDLIATGRIRYVLAFEPAFGYFAGSTEALRVMTAVRTTCRLAVAGGASAPSANPFLPRWQDVLYDCAGARIR